MPRRVPLSLVLLVAFYIAVFCATLWIVGTLA